MGQSAQPEHALGARSRRVAFAVLSGIITASAFPPVDAKWFVWLGLVPLCVAVERSGRVREAFWLGYLAGLLFFLFTLHPLVSAHAWTGWAAQSPSEFAKRMTGQWWFLNGVWVAFALWGALFWAAWAAAAKRYARGRGWRALAVTVSAWILIAEWARAHTTFGFTWAVLGNATADLSVIRQLAALGGVWLLSALVVAVNVGLADLFRPGERRRAVSLPVTVLALTFLAGLAGAFILNRPLPTLGAFQAAALQQAKPSYSMQDFLSTGLDRSYVPMVHQALGHQARLVMLPESIVLGATSLDGTASKIKPTDWQVPRSKWDTQMRELLAGTPAVLVLGLDTIEGGLDHNTLVAWTAEGAAGWYHKRRLVPFSEYQPSGWGSWVIHGQSEYSPGHGSQLIRAQGMLLGGFICQEVLFPALIRQSVLDGATVLISGGNDGVFGDPAVAQVHADAAQLRAVETGRYLVRAMKSGISAVVDPRGRELIRSRSSEPALLVQSVSPAYTMTPYMRLGNWVVWVAAAVLFLGVLFWADDGG